MQKSRKLDLYKLDPILLETSCILIGKLTWGDYVGGQAPIPDLYLEDYDITIESPKFFYRCECSDEASTEETDPKLLYHLFCEIEEDLRFVYVLFTPTEKNPIPEKENTLVLGYDGGIPLPCFRCGSEVNCITERCKSSICNVTPGFVPVKMLGGCPPFLWVINSTPVTWYDFGNYGFTNYYTEDRYNTLIMDVFNYAVDLIAVSSTVTDKYGRTASCTYNAICNEDMGIVALDGKYEIEPGNCNWFGSANSRKYSWNLYEEEGEPFHFDSAYHLYAHDPVADSVHVCAGPLSYCDKGNVTGTLEMICRLNGDYKVVSTELSIKEPEQPTIVYITSHMNCEESQQLTSSDGQRYNWKVTNTSTGGATYYSNTNNISIEIPACDSTACYSIANSCTGSLEVVMYCNEDEGSPIDTLNITVNCTGDDSKIAYWKVGFSVGCGPSSYCGDTAGTFDVCVQYPCPIGHVYEWQYTWWNAYNCKGIWLLKVDGVTAIRAHACSMGCTPGTMCPNGIWGPGDMIDKRVDCPSRPCIGCAPGGPATSGYMSAGCCPEDLL
jgi:hypothetical protein